MFKNLKGFLKANEEVISGFFNDDDGDGDITDRWVLTTEAQLLIFFFDNFLSVAGATTGSSAAPR